MRNTGIGGLASALALARAGFHNIDIFEQTKSSGFTGAGIQLTPNMVRILDRFGVWESIQKDAVPVERIAIRSKLPCFSRCCADSVVDI